MKKVFSVEKFIKDQKQSGREASKIELSLSLWAKECDGLTEDEMEQLGCVTDDDWMIEVEEVVE